MIVACANKGNSVVTPEAQIKFNVNMPSMANKRFSAYVFLNGTLKGAALSNQATDSSGKLVAKAMKVDANGCITGEFMGVVSGTIGIHYRLDSAGSASYVYPNGCSSSAGFLSDALLGADISSVINNNPIDLQITSMSATSTIQFNFSGTGLNAVSRQVYCSILNGATASPSINVGSTMGFAQGTIAFTTGAASATTTARATISASALMYACWIDFNGSGTYNSGDLVANGSISSTTVSISTWGTIP